MLRQIVEVAAFMDAPVLITADMGTGRRSVARLFTRRPGQDRPTSWFCDCTIVVPGLSGSEFFGHEKGSFTGATSVRNGALRWPTRARLLDEVGELLLPLQAEILRVVQEHTYKRVGETSGRTRVFASSAPPTAIWRASRREGRFRNRMCLTGFRAGPFACRRCASAARTSCRWWSASWRSTCAPPRSSTNRSATISSAAATTATFASFASWSRAWRTGTSGQGRSPSARSATKHRAPSTRRLTSGATSRSGSRLAGRSCSGSG